MPTEEDDESQSDEKDEEVRNEPDPNFDDEDSLFGEDNEMMEDYLDESECFWCEVTDTLLEDVMSEAIIRKRVIRDGKVKYLYKSNRKGYKIRNGREIQMSPMEIMKKRRAAKKAWLKKRSRKGSIFGKRKKSYAARKQYHL